MTTLARNQILFGVAIAALALSAGAPALAAKGAPDLILTNGKVYTGDESSPWAEAVAVKDGRIVEVGAADAVMALKGKKTNVVDLEGRMAMASISDAHSHPMDGAIKKLFQCNFPFSSGPDEIAAVISACVARRGEGEWIVGGQWDSNFFVNNKFDSPRKWLDKVSGDKAVVLIDDSGHNVWANSRALELTGITAETPDPEGGRYRREADGVTPNGVIEEAAAKAAEEAAAKAAEEAKAAADAAANAAAGAAASAASIFDPANFDAVKVAAAIDASSLDDATKTALKAAVDAAKNSPEELAAVLDRVKTALGL